MMRVFTLLSVALALAGCGHQGRGAMIISEPHLPVRVPSECRVNSKSFIKIRETGSYGPGDLARDWRRGKQLYRQEAARADRCRAWVRRVHQSNRRSNSR
jgi:hypothetical protein